jgi:hypothetical protein
MQLNVVCMNMRTAQMLHSTAMQLVLKRCKPKTCLFPIYVKKRRREAAPRSVEAPHPAPETRRPLISSTSAIGSAKPTDFPHRGHKGSTIGALIATDIIKASQNGRDRSSDCTRIIGNYTRTSRRINCFNCVINELSQHPVLKHPHFIFLHYWAVAGLPTRKW